MPGRLSSVSPLPTCFFFALMSQMGLLLIGKTDRFYARALISVQSAKTSDGPLSPPANSPQDDREPSSVTCSCNYLRCNSALAAGTASTNKVAMLRLFDPLWGGLRCRVCEGTQPLAPTPCGPKRRMKCHNQLLYLVLP